MTHSAVDSAFLGRLRTVLGDALHEDQATRDAFSSDFGRFVSKTPAAVARCRSTEEVAAVVRLCAEAGVPVSSRGQGHTQTGQSITHGIVLDTAAMDRILTIDQDRQVAVCEGGVVWRDLVLATLLITTRRMLWSGTAQESQARR